MKTPTLKQKQVIEFEELSDQELEARFRNQSDDELMSKAFHLLSVKRLGQLCDPLGCWIEQDKPIEVSEIQACLDAGKEALVETPLWTEIAFGKRSITPEENRQRHIQKVAYFVRHEPQEPISIDVGCPSFGHVTDHLVDDGNHRLAGRILAKATTIAVRVGGEVNEARRQGLWNPTLEEQELCRRQLARLAEPEAIPEVPKPKRAPTRLR